MNEESYTKLANSLIFIDCEDKFMRYALVRNLWSFFERKNMRFVTMWDFDPCCSAIGGDDIGFVIAVKQSEVTEAQPKNKKEK